MTPATLVYSYFWKYTPVIDIHVPKWYDYLSLGVLYYLESSVTASNVPQTIQLRGALYEYVWATQWLDSIDWCFVCVASLFQMYTIQIDGENFLLTFDIINIF